MISLITIKRYALLVSRALQRGGMTQEVEQSSGNQRVSSLIPGSSREHAEMSLSKTLNP